MGRSKRRPSKTSNKAHASNKKANQAPPPVGKDYPVPASVCVEDEASALVGHVGRVSITVRNSIQVSTSADMTENAPVPAKRDSGSKEPKPTVGASAWKPPSGPDLEWVTINQIKTDMFSNNAQAQLTATRFAGRLLNLKRIRIPKFIEAGLVEKWIEFTKNENNPVLQTVSAYALAYIAAGNELTAKCVVDAGGIEALLKLACGPIPQNAVMALGNIAESGPNMRDTIINKGVVPVLVALARHSDWTPLLQKLASALRSVCRVRHPIPCKRVSRLMIPALARLIKSTDLTTVYHACAALSYLTGQPVDLVDEVIESGAVPTIACLLDCNLEHIVKPCLRIVCDLLTGSDAQTQVAIDGGALPNLKKLLNSEDLEIREEATWAMYNLCLGTFEQVSEMFRVGIVATLLENLEKGDLDVQRDICEALNNIPTRGNADHMEELFKAGAIRVFCITLKSEDCESVLSSLDFLGNMLMIAKNVGEEKFDEVALAIENHGGVDIIEELQEHENVDIYKKCHAIITTYFD